MIYKNIKNWLTYFHTMLISLFCYINENLAKDLISGYHFAEPSTRQIQDDDFINPAFIWIEHGEELWDKIEGPSELACSSCHGKISNMKKVVLKFPR